MAADDRFGHSDMYWYRVTERLERNSLVGTTVRDSAQLPEPLVADEHHADWAGQKGYIPTTVGGGCILGVAMTASADDAHLPSNPAWSGKPLFAHAARKLDVKGDSRVPHHRIAKCLVLIIASEVLVTAAEADLIVNGGFETGDFTGWSTLGDTGVQTSAFGSNPTLGIYQTLLTTINSVTDGDPSFSGSDAVSSSILEAFLGLSPGYLDTLGGGDCHRRIRPEADFHGSCWRYPVV